MPISDLIEWNRVPFNEIKFNQGIIELNQIIVVLNQVIIKLNQVIINLNQWILQFNHKIHIKSSYNQVVNEIQSNNKH